VTLAFRVFGQAPRLPRIDTPERLARVKREILTDVINGVVPPTVKSFSELHDYVDANCYGGLCDELGPLSRGHPVDGRRGWVEPINRLQDAVDKWIRAGGVRQGRVDNVHGLGLFDFTLFRWK